MEQLAIARKRIGPFTAEDEMEEQHDEPPGH